MNALTIFFVERKSVQRGPSKNEYFGGARKSTKEELATRLEIAVGSEREPNPIHQDLFRHLKVNVTFKIYAFLDVSRVTRAGMHMSFHSCITYI